MSDRERAKAAHEKVLSALFQHEKNPTYALAQKTLEIMTSPGEVFLMEEYRFIKYIGNNFNGYPTFQVRF
jgi:hypothetical protein